MGPSRTFFATYSEFFGGYGSKWRAPFCRSLLLNSGSTGNAAPYIYRSQIDLLNLLWVSGSVSVRSYNYDTTGNPKQIQ
jgi:hypothetical protein